MHQGPRQRGLLFLGVTVVQVSAGWGSRVAALGVAVVVLAVVGWVFTQHSEWFGFRDGYASELDTAEHTMAVWFCWFSLAVVVVLAALVWRSFFAGIGRLLLIVAGLYVVAGTVAVGLDLYFRGYMMDSAGG